MSFSTAAYLNSSNLKYNFQQIKKIAPNQKVLVMVKGNAYGHGAIEVVKIIADSADYFGVATIDEAISLREQFSDIKIVLMSGFYKQEQLFFLKKYRLIPVIHSFYQLSLLLDFGIKLEIEIKDLWLKINTGMNRLGFNYEELELLCSILTKHSQLYNSLTILSHLANSEIVSGEFTQKQYQKFKKVIEYFISVKPKLAISAFSLSNSADILIGSKLFDGVAMPEIIRPGLVIYGVLPFSLKDRVKLKEQFDFKPVMTLKSKVIAIHHLKKGDHVGYGSRWKATKKTTIAIVAAGYADGYPQYSPDGTPVLVNGQLAKLAGKVSMDMLTIDVTNLINIKVGDEVILWGDNLSVEDIADKMGISVYGLLTGVSQRVDRVLV